MALATYKKDQKRFRSFRLKDQGLGFERFLFDELGEIKLNISPKIFIEWMGFDGFWWYLSGRDVLALRRSIVESSIQVFLPNNFGWFVSDQKFPDDSKVAICDDVSEKGRESTVHPVRHLAWGRPTWILGCKSTNLRSPTYVVIGHEGFMWWFLSLPLFDSLSTVNKSTNQLRLSIGFIGI